MSNTKSFTDHGNGYQADNVETFVAYMAAAALRGGATALDVATLEQLLVLRLEPSTIALAHRLAHLETTLRDRDPRERREIICERLALSRRRFYELKKISSAALDRTDGV